MSKISLCSRKLEKICDNKQKIKAFLGVNYIMAINQLPMLFLLVQWSFYWKVWNLKRFHKISIQSFSSEDNTHSAKEDKGYSNTKIIIFDDVTGERIIQIDPSFLTIHVEN